MTTWITTLTAGRSRRLAIHLLLVGFLAGSLPALRARAQVKPKVEKEEKEAAAAYARGQKLVEQQKYIGGIAAFKRAYQVKPHFFVLCTIARCYQNLNQMVEAAEHYQRCLDDGAAEASMVKQVTMSLKTVQGQITWVKVVSPGKGGTIHLDGVSVGQAPQRFPINPGRHVIVVRRKDTKPASVTLNTVGGEEREISLVPLDSSPAQTEVSADGNEATVTKPSGRKLSSLWFWGAAGLTAALAVATAILGAQTAGLRSDFDDDPTQETADQFYERRTLTNVFLGLAAAAAAGGTALFFFTDFGGNKESNAGAEHSLLVGAGVRGTF
jgi:hypothetical protein